MYLEFLADGHIDCPLLLISPVTQSESEELYKALLNVATDCIKLLEIHGLPIISPIDGCKLTAQVTDQDHGVVLLPDSKKHFMWELTRQTWKEVLDLLFFFIRSGHGWSGHQWLDETSNISVLISTGNRRW